MVPPSSRRFMSSHSSSASSTSSFPTPGSASAPSSGSRPAGSGSGTLSRNSAAGISAFVTEPDGGLETENQMERGRVGIISTDRKKGADSTADDILGRSAILGEGGDPGPSSRAESHNRPLPSVSSSTSEEPRTPGSSNVNPIDLTSSSPPQPLPRGQSLNSPTLPRRQNNFVEYILPRWQPDSEVNRCPICGTQFSFWYRKHHCRKCGRVVCASCSPHRITIPRQFIVRPPEQDRRPTSMFVQPSTAFSQIVSGDGSTQSSLQQDEHYINPALGGGEEVRLCNPCVPDPNPDPPLGYGAVRSGIASPDWVSGRSALQSRQAMHRTHHSLSSAMFGSAREADRELRRQRGLGMIVCLPCSTADFNSNF